MSRSSADGARPPRAQVEPLAALVAVAAVCIGLGIYAGVLDGAIAPDGDRATVETVADEALRTVAPAGVATPARLGEARDAAPEGYHLNATLLTGDRRWTTGPRLPARARTADGSSVDGSSADRPTGVRVAPGDVRPGTLRVVVWR